jgi:hypothetical protein
MRGGPPVAACGELVDDDRQHVSPAGPVGSSGPDEPVRQWVALAALVVGGVLIVLPASPLWLVLTGITLAVAVGIPLLLAEHDDLARRLLPVVVLLMAMVAGFAAYSRANGSGPVRDRTHDGGVIVTRAAARLAVRGHNPYTASFAADLPPSWARVQGADGSRVANPVGKHDPYLPASFLIQVPFVVGADTLGLTWDPRILGWIVLVGTAVVLARRPGPAWTRIGAVLTVGSAFTVTYLAWGTNDSLAACLLVLALALADVFPRVAGVALAVAISCKFLLLLAVPPLLILVLARVAWTGARRWWTLPATLAVTCVPYVLASPGAFFDDVLWFNLGRTKPLMPTSGLGLPAITSFAGPLLALLTLAGAAIALGLVPWLARRWRSLGVAVVGPLTALALLGVLVPARTFQVNYLVLVVAVAAPAWWLLADRAERPGRASAS